MNIHGNIYIKWKGQAKFMGFIDLKLVQWHSVKGDKAFYDTLDSMSGNNI